MALTFVSCTYLLGSTCKRIKSVQKPFVLLRVQPLFALISALKPLKPKITRKLQNYITRKGNEENVPGFFNELTNP